MKAKKFVVKCNRFEISQMEKAGIAVLKLSGVKSLNVELEDRKLTVTGTVDLSDVLSKLKRIGKKNGHAEVISQEDVDEEMEARNKKRNKIFKILSNCGKGIVSVVTMVTCVAVGVPISRAA